MSDSPSDMILLYDIPGNCSSDKAYSPSVWKTRLVLNYKRLPHKTVWVEYPDIAPLARDLGAPACGTRQDDSPNYAVPILCDRARTYLTNSLDIALYLEDAYPDSPKLFPQDTREFIKEWDDMWMEKAGLPIYRLILEGVSAQLNPASQTYFRTTREAKFGSLQATPDMWNKLEEGLGDIDARIGDQRFAVGEQRTYIDIIMAGWFICMRRVLGHESEGWQRVESMHNGRWKRFLEEFSKLEYV